MANQCILSHEQIIQRRQEAIDDILVEWSPVRGAQSYIIQCPCQIDCFCNNEQNPHITLRNCLYVGELDFFEVHQPFIDIGFFIYCHCNVCRDEMACGKPT